MLAAMAAGMFRDTYGAEASGGGRRSARTDDFARFSPCEFAICKHRTAGVLQLLAPRTNCCLSRNAAGMTYFIGARAIGLEGPWARGRADADNPVPTWRNPSICLQC